MSLLDTASLILTPNGYKGGVTTGKLYSVKPTDASGDMDVTRNTTATRVNSAGVIESVAINVPRLDYTGGGCPSILVEPQRTNYCLNSNDLSQSQWINLTTNTTITRITSGGIAGEFDRLTTTGTGAQGRFVQTSILIGTNAVFSVYLKGTGQVSIGIFNAGQTTNIPLTLTTQWQRFETKITTGIAGYMDFSIYVFGGSTVDVSSSQLEFATYATSYIPTVAATVTRNDDVISKTGVSSLIGQTEGTIFWDIKDLVGTTATGNQDFGIKNTASNHLICLTANSVSLPFRISVISAAGTLINYSANITSAKACVKYGTFGAKLFLNGNSTPVATSAVNPNISFANILFSGARISYKTNSFALWTTALTDAQCINLTT